MAIQNINSNMNNMIQAMNSIANQTALKGVENNSEPQSVNFSDLLKSSLEKVNMSQLQADELSKKIAAGDKSVNLHDVMIAVQTASLSLQETVQVRNKIISAYQEIMNMQV